MEETEQELTEGQDKIKTKDVRREFKTNLNPLEIPVVVKIVCGYIHKVKDLKHFRALNSSWRKETFKKWRNSAIFLINNETLPLLIRAFSEPNWDNLSEEEKTNIDPFELRQVPFKKYRFNSDQLWSYPPREIELDKRLIWEKVISPNATYLDIGESAIKLVRRFESGILREGYILGLEWIFEHSQYVTELALALIKSDEEFKEERNPTGIINAGSLVSMTISSPRQPPRGTQVRPLLDGINIASDMFCRTRGLKNLTLNITNHQGFGIVSGMISNGLIMDGEPKILLNSFNALGIKETWVQYSLCNYLRNTSSQGSLQELRMTFPVSVCLKNCESQSSDIFAASMMYKNVLLKVEGKLTKLELEIDCELKENLKLPINTNLDLQSHAFPKLTEFKINLDYVTFPGRLLTFDLNDLKGMPSLQKFHFGTKSYLVNKPCITRKLDFVEDPSPYFKRKCVQELPHLKSFHFHGNFTKEALQWLGRLAENIKTLEVVLDKENFSAVKEIWPGLRNLMLLPCSNVPVEDVTALENSNPSWNVINNSTKYLQCTSIEAPDEGNE